MLSQGGTNTIRTLAHTRTRFVSPCRSHGSPRKAPSAYDDEGPAAAAPKHRDGYSDTLHQPGRDAYDGGYRGGAPGGPGAGSGYPSTGYDSGAYAPPRRAEYGAAPAGPATGGTGYRPSPAYVASPGASTIGTASSYLFGADAGARAVPDRAAAGGPGGAGGYGYAAPSYPSSPAARQGDSTRSFV